MTSKESMTPEEIRAEVSRLRSGFLPLSLPMTVIIVGTAVYNFLPRSTPLTTTQRLASIGVFAVAILFFVIFLAVDAGRHKRGRLPGRCNLGRAG